MFNTCDIKGCKNSGSNTVKFTNTSFNVCSDHRQETFELLIKYRKEQINKKAIQLLELIELEEIYCNLLTNLEKVKRRNYEKELG